MLALASGCTLRSTPPPTGGAVSGIAVSQAAKSAIGTRYVYGGASPSKGFDCSGLVCWAYGKYGVKLPRTARDQSSMGATVAKKNLRPGDVVVFKISGGWHTGIYTGNGKFVHSPQTGKTVREDDINAKYYSGKFVSGRRIQQVY